MLLAANPLEEIDWLFPATECLHIAGFTLSVGTIAIVDFCVLGAGVPRKYASSLSDSLSMWTLVGVALMLFTGPLLYLGNGGAVQYNRNPGFQFKMVCLLAALIFQYTIHNRTVRKVETPDEPIVLTKSVAAVSLVLWTCVVFGGIFIAFTEA
jgi:hypothetical protein